MNRRRLADETIRLGVFLQIVFLALVDWGTIAGIASSSQTPWRHIVGLIAVNVVLLASAAVAWRWMGRSQRKLRRAEPSSSP